MLKGLPKTSAFKEHITEKQAHNCGLACKLHLLKGRFRPFSDSRPG